LRNVSSLCRSEEVTPACESRTGKKSRVGQFGSSMTLETHTRYQAVSGCLAPNADDETQAESVLVAPAKKDRFEVPPSRLGSLGIDISLDILDF
jgi:hypothetical protein